MIPLPSMRVKRTLRLPWWAGLALTLLLLGLATVFSPLERTLGANARLVYLHGAWVWSGMLVFLASALMGASALLTRRAGLHAWSRALGWTGLGLWLTYLPLAMLVMQLNWGGMFFDEPRWRVPLAFGVAGLLLQLGLLLLDRPPLTSAANAVFGTALFLSLGGLPYVLHPDSPILNSPSRAIQAFFAGMLLLLLLAALQVARRLARHSSQG